jgi:NAD(P)-dependent dehydrogenase (short-subunit alcohol dehydrogenase family)
MTEGYAVTADPADTAIDPLPADRAYYRVGTATRPLVVVSNRVTPAGGAKPDSGGLAVAIRSALQESGGIWFGWSGEVAEEPTDEPRRLDVTEEHWDAVMNINAKAVFFATQAVLPTMIAQKRGVIVNLASMAGKIGSRANLPYNASKAAVISMTKSLAVAHAADGIRVNCVCPGFVETDMWTVVAREQAALLD